MWSRECDPAVAHGPKLKKVPPHARCGGTNDFLELTKLPNSLDKLRLQANTAEQSKAGKGYQNNVPQYGGGMKHISPSGLRAEPEYIKRLFM